MTYNKPFSTRARTKQSAQTLKDTGSDHDIYARVTIYIPAEIFSTLRDYSRELGLPMSRLVVQAIDNELDCDPPFNYPCAMPDIPYVEGDNLSESQKIFDFIKLFKNGVSLDSIMACRRDIGVYSKQRLLLGFRELVKKELIKEHIPTHVKFKGFRKEYRHWRINL